MPAYSFVLQAVVLYLDDSCGTDVNTARGSCGYCVCVQLVWGLACCGGMLGSSQL